MSVIPSISKKTVIFEFSLMDGGCFFGKFADGCREIYFVNISCEVFLVLNLRRDEKIPIM